MRNLYLVWLLFATVLFSCCTDETIHKNYEEHSLSASTRSLSEQSSFNFPEIRWESLENHAQKVAACQIPDSLLPSIPTDELVSLCMEYPMLLDAYAFNSFAEGVKNVLNDFNGYTELKRRKDCCLAFFEYLKQYKIDYTSEKLALAKKSLIYSIGEMALAGDEILSTANFDLRREIASFSHAVWESKESKPLYYALSAISSSAYLYVKAISSQQLHTRSTGNVNPVIKSFLATGNIHNMEELSELKKAYQITF